MPKPRCPCYREPHLVSLLKGGTAQIYSVTFSSTEVAPVSFPESQRRVGLSAWASPGEVSRGSPAQEEIWLKSHINRGRGSISMGDVWNSKGQHTKKELKWSQMTQLVKLQERGQRGEESG